jgi:hypothetical protein
MKTTFEQGTNENMMQDLARIGPMVTAIVLVVFEDYAWVGMTVLAILLIIYIEVQRARRRAKRERDREDLRRHITGGDIDE